MLRDTGKLGEVLMTNGGGRRVTAPAAEACRAEIERSMASAPTPRQAGIEANLKHRPDEHFAETLRGKAKDRPGVLRTSPGSERHA
jgi:hypothetical protein